MNNFNFENKTKVYFGKGGVKEYLGALLKNYGNTVMLAYGGGSIKENGIYDEVMGILNAAGKTVVEFSGIMSNPTYAKVQEGAKLARDNHVDLILAVGGGSVSDCCKVVSAQAKVDEDLWDLENTKHTYPTEFIPLGTIACRKCAVTGKCVFDDVVNEVAPKLAEADAFVIGAPVYFSSPAGGAISFLDRMFFSTLGIDKTMKVGAAVVTCRRGGNTASFDVLNKYFMMNGMPVASSQYWNMVYGGSAEEVAQDAEGLQTMRTLGRNMAFMMKSFQLGKEQFGLPQKEAPIFTSFHR